MFLIFLLFIVDIFTIFFFKSRVSVFDTVQFMDSSAQMFSSIIPIVILALVSLLVIFFFFVQSKFFQKYQKLFVSIYFLLFVFSYIWVIINSPYGMKSIPENVLSMNFWALKDGQKIKEEKFATYQDYFTLQKWLDKKPNIIVVFAESLSAIDSLRVWWKNDNLTYFDKIQKDWITFTNFISNGCTSDTAHVWLLLGIDPMKMLWPNITAYSGYKKPTEPLPKFFGQQWYDSTFVSTVSLDFLNQRNFLSGVGFDKIIWEEYFKDNKKYVFKAAPDYDLYNKALEVVTNKTTDPYLLVLQNISFHKPYDTPYGKTEQDALRYSDRMLYYFYLQLKKANFFENWILVIIGDHRKMEPLEEWEKETLWDFRYTRSLATVVWKWVKPWTTNPNIIQPTDFFYSLKQLIWEDMHLSSKLFNYIFSLDKKRDRWFVYCKYFDTNQYAIISSTNTGKIFNSLSEISTSHPFVYDYISSYLWFQYWSSNNIIEQDDLLLIAHRWTPYKSPENSLQWFLLAKQNWAHSIELDVSYTKDKQNIVAHWESMWWTVCWKNYLVYNHSLQKLKKECPLNNWEILKSLEEMLRDLDWLFDYYFVDIKVYKEDDAEQQTLDVINTVKKLGMQDKVIISSYNKKSNYILWSHHDVLAWRDAYTLNERDLLPNINHQYYLIPYEFVSENTAQELADIGKKLVVYTVNNTGDIEKLYRRWVRMIMTDDIPMMKEWLENQRKPESKN